MTSLPKIHVLATAVVAVLLAFSLHGNAKASYDESRAWFGSMSDGRQAALQTDLYWAGTYDGPIDGLFGPKTYAAVTEFQSQFGRVRSGVLSSEMRARLRRFAAQNRLLVRRLERDNRVTPGPVRTVRVRPAPVVEQQHASVKPFRTPILVLP